jgi:outer membrane receptor protein involved in Fe transport
MLPLMALFLLAIDDPPVPAPPRTVDTIVVTATNTPARLGDSPASVVVISRQSLASTATATTDDALRQVPGFTLFRRSGSRSANPTSQGVSLRGIGASGASRALVLDDGIPLNDPFGGWVYWGRVPRQAIAQIEVVRGGASDLYGSGAMGGVVQFVRRGTTADDVAFDASGGTERTGTSSLFVSMKRGDWSGSVAAGWLTTGGYVLVAPSQRGAVDVDANTRDTTIDATLRRNGSFVRLSHYAESRNNGTPLQINDTAIRQIAAGSDITVGPGAVVVARTTAIRITTRRSPRLPPIATANASPSISACRRRDAEGRCSGSPDWAGMSLSPAPTRGRCVARAMSCSTLPTAR